MIDNLVQSRRNRGAAARFFRRLLKAQGHVPLRLITDKLLQLHSTPETAGATRSGFLTLREPSHRGIVTPSSRQLDCEHDLPTCRGRSVTPTGAILQ